jgi:hypothetical protein
VKYKGDEEKDPGYPSMLLFIDVRRVCIRTCYLFEKIVFSPFKKKRKKIEKGKEKSNK